MNNLSRKNSLEIAVVLFLLVIGIVVGIVTAFSPQGKGLLGSLSGAAGLNTPPTPTPGVAYRYGDEIGAVTPSDIDMMNWMAALDDGRLLSTLSLPGTHDSGADHPGKEPLVQCQEASIKEQLESGIRVLDIRLWSKNQESLGVFHGNYYQNLEFSGVLTAVKEFLRDHPTETVLMRLQEEVFASDTICNPSNLFQTGICHFHNESFAQNLTNELDAYGKDDYGQSVIWKATTPNPRLGEIRGKIVIMDSSGRFPKGGSGLTTIGIDWDSLGATNQDNSDICSAGEILTKWADIESNLLEADKESNFNEIYINHLSAGSAGCGLLYMNEAPPYLIASGHNYDEFDVGGHITVEFYCCEDDCVSKSNPELKRKDFPMFQCKSVYIGDGWGSQYFVEFTGTNDLLGNWWLPSHPLTRRTGIIMADFPGKDLIYRIVEVNHNRGPIRANAVVNRDFISSGEDSYYLEEGKSVAFIPEFWNYQPPGGFIELRQRWIIDDGVWDSGETKYFLTNANVPTYTFEDEGTHKATLTLQEVYMGMMPPPGFEAKKWTATITFTVHNAAPELQGVSRQDSGIGTTTISGTVVDPGELDTQTVTINWGRGPLVKIPIPADKTFTASGSIDPLNPVIVTVTDNDGGENIYFVREGVILTGSEVQNTFGSILPPPNLLARQENWLDIWENYNLESEHVGAGGPYVASEGTPITFVPDFSQYSFRIGLDQYKWIFGDGSQDSSIYQDFGAGYEIQHTYPNSGVYNAKLWVRNRTKITIVTVPVTILNVSPVLQGLSRQKVGTTTTISGTVVNPVVTDTCTVAVYWGGGSVEEVPVSADGTFSASRDSIDDSTPVLASVVDDDGGGNTYFTGDTSPYQIEAATLIGETIDENGMATVVGVFPQINTAEPYTSTVNWGDGVIEENTHPSGTVTLILKHQYLDNPSGANDYRVVVTVTDDKGATSTAETTVTVNNVNPVASIDNLTNELGMPVKQGGRTALAGLALNLAGSFSDAGTLDTHTAHIDWGDGTSDDPGSTASRLVMSHTFKTPGEYTIQFVITDDDGGVGKSAWDVQVLTPEEGLQKAVNDLKALPTDTNITAAIGKLVGEKGGNSASGAFDLLTKGDVNAAFEKIGQALSSLNNAASSDSLAIVKADLALVAKSATLRAIQKAAAVATKSNDLAKINQARGLAEKGDGLLQNQDYLGAVNAYRSAIQAIQGIKP